MATTKKRINISVSKEIDEALGRLAERDQMPQATKAEHLLSIALELEEDEVLNAVAAKRDRKGSTYVSHASAWR
jgi:predicted DNA-binding protein